MKRNYTDTDGICFASFNNSSDCSVLSDKRTDCGTYMCPFYKSKDYRNWVRINGKSAVTLIPSEEYFKVTDDDNDSAD